MENLRVTIEIEDGEVRATNRDTGEKGSGSYRAKESPDGHQVLACYVVWETEASERRNAFQVIGGGDAS